MRIIIALVITFSCLSIFSCSDEEYLYDETKEINNQVWLYKDSISFTLPISDTSAVYQILLDVSHGKDYPYENFYTEIATYFPNGKRTTDVISLELINDYGDSRGACSSSECTVPLDLLKSVKFESPGNYTIVFKQHTRQDSLQDIYSLRMMVKRK